MDAVDSADSPAQPAPGERPRQGPGHAAPDSGPVKRAAPPGSASRGRRRGGGWRPAGFEDGIERAVCPASPHQLVTAFPVQHRTGAATLRRLVVARRPDALLLCDSAHHGAHRWPDDDPVTDDEISAVRGQAESS